MNEFKTDDTVRILVGGPHENFGRTATVSRIQEDGEVVIYFGDQDEGEWVYSPGELEKVDPTVFSMRFTEQERVWLMDGINDLTQAMQAFDNATVTKDPDGVIEHLRERAEALNEYLKRKVVEP